MSNNSHFQHSSLSAASGLGSAKSGVEPWYLERFTALVLIPTGLYVLFGFLNNVVPGGYSGAMYWLQSPVAATFTVLFLLAGLRHLVCGLTVVIDDYIHRNFIRFCLLFTVKFGATVLAILGTLSIAKIFFGV